MNDAVIVRAYELARERYAALGVSTDRALETLAGATMFLPCWHGDDAAGLGSAPPYAAAPVRPGAARTAEELRRDLAKALSLIPGAHGISITPAYGEFPAGHDRLRPAAEHFQGWGEWAARRSVTLDLRVDCGGPRQFTLSHLDGSVRRTWMEYIDRCRKLAAGLHRDGIAANRCTLAIADRDGESLNRHAHRALLREALDELLDGERRSITNLQTLLLPDSGAQAGEYAICSTSFVFGYVLSDHATICMPVHPDDTRAADEVSVLLQFVDELGLSIGGGRTRAGLPPADDRLLRVLREVVRSDAVTQVHFLPDFLEPRLNRVGGWVLAVRSLQRLLLQALLEPDRRLRALEKEGDRFAIRATLEEISSLPYGAVWDYFCLTRGVPCGDAYIPEIDLYERDILDKRK